MRRSPHTISALAAAVVAAGLLIQSAPVRAGGYAVSEQSAVAGGSGGAGTARTDDAGGTWYNPAALADGGGLRLGVGLLMVSPSVRASDVDGSWSTSADNSPATPPHLHASYSDGRFAAGLYAGVPFGGGVSWPEDWAGRHEIVSSRLEVYRVAPFVGWRIGRVRLAAGVHLDAARLRIRRGLDFVNTEGDVRLDLDGTGIGLDLSTLVQVRDDLNVGVSYKSRSTIALSGNANFEAPPAFAMTTPDQRAQTDLALPDRIAVGASYQRGAWRALADVEVSLWGVNDELVIDFEHEATPDPVQRNNWRNTMALRLGGELDLRRDLRVRAGAFLDPSPAPRNNLAPSSPDATRMGLAGGASFRITDDLSADGFYEYLHLLGRESSSMEALAARYSGHAHMLGAGLRFRH